MCVHVHIYDLILIFLSSSCIFSFVHFYLHCVYTISLLDRKSVIPAGVSPGADRTPTPPSDPIDCNRNQVKLCINNIPAQYKEKFIAYQTKLCKINLALKISSWARIQASLAPKVLIILATLLAKGSVCVALTSALRSTPD